MLARLLRLFALFGFAITLSACHATGAPRTAIPAAKTDVPLASASGKQTAVFGRTCSMAGIFGIEVSEIPNAVVQALGIEVDEANFLRGIELGQSTDAGTHEEAKVFVSFATEIGVEELRVGWIIDGSQDVRVDVIHGLALQ